MPPAQSMGTIDLRVNENAFLGTGTACLLARFILTVPRQGRGWRRPYSNGSRHPGENWMQEMA